MTTDDGVEFVRGLLVQIGIYFRDEHCTAKFDHLVHLKLQSFIV